MALGKRYLFASSRDLTEASPALLCVRGTDGRNRFAYAHVSNERSGDRKRSPWWLDCHSSQVVVRVPISIAF
jgi:hypothetical protein